MKNISLKKLMLALLLTAAVPTLTAQVHVGDILCEGNLIYPPSTYPVSGATAIGVVFYVDNTGQHGWAVALQDAGSFAWGCYGSDMPLPNYTNKRQAIYDLDGYENTRIVRENCTDSPAFYAVDFANGWYVPAIGQLNYLYGNLVEVNTSLQVAGGTVFYISSDVSNRGYWSSTEYSHVAAWSLEKSGNVCAYTTPTKTYGRFVRAIRNF